MRVLKSGPFLNNLKPVELREVIVMTSISHFKRTNAAHRRDEMSRKGNSTIQNGIKHAMTFLNKPLQTLECQSSCLFAMIKNFTTLETVCSVAIKI